MGKNLVQGSMICGCGCDFVFAVVMLEGFMVSSGGSGGG